ncbi:hypothetical protein ODJ79_22945 [Actinoplanes sp. KI2]|uniref:hypothetical protein n=1 Tax=Actinoplanes sp. KI2 TaxID=2983315 RepID=UPI0021D5F9F1|nr:hypothetical protein [Actinoplanes sp. KI2]MCU7726599.1 hypothetical protein [Actinoplanes sp. KI2]
MIFRLVVATARFRRPLFVGGVLLLAATVVAGRLGGDREVLVFLPAGMFVVGAGLAVVTFVAPSTRRPPAALVADGRSLRTPRTVVLGLAAFAHLGLIGMVLLFPAEMSAEGVACIAFLFCYLRAVWRGVGLTITAEGLRADKYSGTLTVPWEAMSPVPPKAVMGPAIELTYDRRESARTTGFVLNRRQMLVEGVDPEFVAAAIHHYRTHPEERALIGTAAAEVAPLPESPVTLVTRARLAAVTVICGVVTIGVVAADVGADGLTGPLGSMAHLAAMCLAVAAGTVFGMTVRAYRRSRR